MEIETIIVGRDALVSADAKAEKELGRGLTPTEGANVLSEAVRMPVSWDEERQTYGSERASEDKGLELLLEYATLFLSAQRTSPVELLSSSLSHSEKRIALAVFDSAMGRTAYTVNGVALSRIMGTARSFVTACLSKIKASGIINVRSLGKKGTLIHILDAGAADRARSRFARETRDDPLRRTEP